MDNNKSFFSSVLRDSVIVLLICILMLEGAFLIVTKAYIENQAIKNSHIMSLNYANYLDKILGEPVSALQAIKLNINYLNIKENRVKTELYSIITSMCSKNGYFYSIELLDVDGKVVLASGRSLSLKSDRSSTSAFLNRKKGNPIFWSSTFSSEHTGKTTLTLSYEFKNFTVVGYLNFDKISILTGDFQASNTADYKYYVTDEKGIYIYYEDKDLVAQRRVDPNFQTIRDIYNSEKTRLEEIINGKKAIVSVNKTKTANWYIVNYSDSKIISDSLAVVIAFFTISMLMLILTILFLFIKKSRNLTRLITQINLSSVEIAKGNYSEKMEAQKYSELNKTVEQFNLMVEDIQARDEKLLEIAYTDYLTKVANRAGLVKYLDEAIQNNPTNSFSIIYMDIDNFKRINDTYGHSIGDQLLVNLFKVLKKLSPVNSKLARIGGDEILIVYQCDGEKKNTKEFIEKLLKATKTPIAFDGKVFSITLSGGISLYPDDGNNFEELLRASDIALYYSKSNGKNIFTFFDEKMSKKLKRDFQIENNLKAAIERGEFYLVYQPVLGADEQIRGFEALIRWNNPEMGEVMPDEFIPIAEETKKIIEIGRFVFEEACKMILEINQKFGTNYIVSVNCSAIELTAKDYFEFIINTMNNMNVPPNWIEIEITEKVSIDIDTQNYSVLTQLQETGISLAIDDFGTGYSSLSSLVNLPVSTLKLDRVFIGDVSENINKQKIIKSVVEMSKVLNYEVIAEGVETLEQLEILKNTLCEFFQGYYFSKPILFEELIKYLENKKIIDNGEII